MKTEVTLYRPFMGGQVRQKSKSELLSATDLVKIGNVKRQELGLGHFNLNQYLKTKSTKEFIASLQKESKRVVQKGRGRNGGTWVHPLLLIDIALSLNPSFKVEVYKWMMDELLKSRNDSGDSYKKMAGALFDNIPYREAPQIISKVALYVRKQCGVTDWNTASEKQLKLRDRMHENISLLCDVLRDYKQAVRIGVQKAIEEQK